MAGSAAINVVAMSSANEQMSVFMIASSQQRTRQL